MGRAGARELCALAASRLLLVKFPTSQSLAPERVSMWRVVGKPLTRAQARVSAATWSVWAKAKSMAVRPPEDDPHSYGQLTVP